MKRTEWVFYRLKHLMVGGAAAGTRTFRITRDEYFVAFRVGYPQTGILCEVAASTSLPPSHALTSVQEAEIKQLGFIPPGETKTFTLIREDVTDDVLQTLATMAIKIIEEIFTPATDSAYEFEFYHKGGRTARALQWIAVSFLRELIANGNTTGLLTFESGRVYCQFTFIPEKQEIYCELVSNQYLPKDLQLTPEKITLITACGFQSPIKEGNFNRTYPTGDSKIVENAVQEILGLFTKAYGLDPIPQFKVILTIN